MIKRIWHRIEHWLGWNQTYIESWQQGIYRYRNHRCSECDRLTHVERELSFHGPIRSGGYDGSDEDVICNELMRDHPRGDSHDEPVNIPPYWLDLDIDFGEKGKYLDDLMGKMVSQSNMKKDIIALSVLRDYLGELPDKEEISRYGRGILSVDGLTYSFKWKNEILCEWADAHVGLSGGNRYIDYKLNIEYRLMYCDGSLDFMLKEEYKDLVQKLNFNQDSFTDEDSGDD